MYEDQIERLKREIQSLEREIGGNTYREDMLTQKIRGYELAQQRSPSSANAYARQIESLNLQIDKLRSERMNLSSKLSQKERELALWEKRAAESKARSRSQSSGHFPSLRKWGTPPPGTKDNDPFKGGPGSPLGPGPGVGSGF